MTSSKIKPNLVRYYLSRALTKEAQDNEEFAPGIPDKGQKHKIKKINRFTDENEIWELAVQRHDAEDAGEHRDLRLGDDEKSVGYSWALPKGLPNLNEKNLAIRQPDHTLDYFDFEGEIEEGYGAGEVELEKRDKVEVLESGDNKIKFNMYDGNKNREYTMVKTDYKNDQDNWLLINTTKTEEDVDIPHDKPNFNRATEEEINRYIEPRYIMEPKIDGAHMIFDLKPGTHPRAFSYRKGENETGVIEHTWKFKDLKDEKVPEDMPRVKLRGEGWGEDEMGEAISANRLAGILNSGVWNSREKQDEEGELRATIFDVIEYNGQDVENAPYDEKADILQEVDRRVFNLDKPEMAIDEKDKKRMFKKIKEGAKPQTNEGAIFWDRSGEQNPIKVKLMPEYDVVIEEIFPASEGTKYEGTHAGGFKFSWGNENNHKIVGRVGTGFSDKLRKDMHENPEKYEGLVAKVQAQDVYEDKDDKTQPGALRAPSFKGWHLDKNVFIPDIKK